MVICRAALRNIASSIKLTADKYTIEQSTKIKILGVYFTNTLDNTANVNQIIQKVNYRISVISKLTKYSNTKTNLLLYNSLILSIFKYCLENIINIKQTQINKLNVLLNKCANRIIGYRALKMSTMAKLQELNWISFPQMVCYQSLKLIHKISYNNEPLALTKYLYHSQVRSELARYVRKPSVQIQYSSAKMKNSFFHRAIYLYNRIPDEVRLNPLKKFSKLVKEYIFHNYDLKTIPKIPDKL